jgi:hypothetical protein
MIIYNVTTNIDGSVHEQWLRWMQQEHIPAVLATGKFSGARIVRVLAEEDAGRTYSVQFTAPDRETLLRYYEEDAPALRQDALKLFGDKVLSFRTELELISDH